MSKLKHVQLFENFSEGGKTPMIVATSDYSKILKNPEDALTDAYFQNSWLMPSKFIITYYTNPSPELVSEYNEQNKKLDFTLDEDEPLDPMDAMMDLLTADQNGINITRSNYGGKMIVKVDPEISPEAYEEIFEEQIESINIDHGEANICESVLEGHYGELNKFTPEFIAHCKEVMSKDPFILKNPYTKTELFAGNKQKMEPRVEMEFTIM